MAQIAGGGGGGSGAGAAGGVIASPTMPNPKTTSPDIIVAWIVAHAKNAQGTYQVPALLWPAVVQYFNERSPGSPFSTQTDLIVPFEGPYANLGFSRLALKTGSQAISSIGTQIAQAPGNAISGAFSFLSFLGSGSFWGGLGLSLAGVALVGFGVFQLAGVGKTTAIKVLS